MSFPEFSIKRPDPCYTLSPDLVPTDLYTEEADVGDTDNVLCISDLQDLIARVDVLIKGNLPNDAEIRQQVAVEFRKVPVGAISEMLLDCLNKNKLPPTAMIPVFLKRMEEATLLHVWPC